MARRIEVTLLGAALAGWWEGSAVVMWFAIVGVLGIEIAKGAVE
jgi:hypothetical protein